MTTKDTSTIGVEDVKKLATLARIDLSEIETEHLANEIGGILGYVKQIIATDISGSESEAIGPYNIMREDENPNTAGENTKKLLAGAPDSDGQYLKVKNIL